MTILDAQIRTVARLQPIRVTGRIAALRGLILLVRDLPLPVGSLVTVGREGDGAAGEVIGFDQQHAVVMMLGGAAGVRAGDRVVGGQAAQTVGVGPGLLGRVIDGLGRPIDGKGPLRDTSPRPLDPGPLRALERRRITQPMPTGVRAVDLMTTLGRGQRMGIFAGPGVGKSTLLGTIVRRCAADVGVVALVGERGREVKDFVECSLGPEGLARSVVVVATGDESPLMRIRAAMVACAAAEEFRDGGRDVMLVMDSVTRLAHAQRQIGLSVGEPPATRGYTPSVFSLMARLLERAGAVEAPAGSPPGRAGGSITGLYTVLVEGDEMTEPVADAARGILDGHIILSRALAQKGHYPAIDVLDSISRVADDVTDAAHRAARRQVVRLMAAYRGVEDLVQIGAYAKGSSPESDVAIAYHPRIADMLQQERDGDGGSGGGCGGAANGKGGVNAGGPETFEAARGRMVRLAVEAGADLQRAGAAPAAGRRA